MKVKITYTEQERRQADKLAALYMEQLQSRDRITVKRSDRHKPYYHIYISDKQPKRDKKFSEGT